MEWSVQADEFQASNAERTITIFVRQTLRSSDSLGLIHGKPSYATADGEEVERMDGRRFRLINTGEVFERT